MSILHTILTQDIPAISDELSCINHGGCGHFAYQLHMALAEHNISSDIVLVDWCYDEDDVAEFVSDVGGKDYSEALAIRYANGRSNGQYVNPCFGHLCLRVDGVLYDSEGVSSDHRAISEAIKAASLALTFTAEKTWNPTFLDCNSGHGDGAVHKMQAFIKQALLPLAESGV